MADMRKKLYGHPVVRTRHFSMRKCPRCDMPYATLHWPLEVQYNAWIHHQKVCALSVDELMSRSANTAANESPMVK